jgi:hypothetical protein
MNGYVCFYNGKREEVKAETTLQAMKKVAAKLKVPTSKQHMISAVLAEVNDEQVVHTPVD